MSNLETALDQIKLDSFLNLYGTMTSGATLPQRSIYPTALLEVGRKPRNSSTNDFWGNIITRPSENELIIGLTYLDKHESPPAENEDIYQLLIKEKKLVFWPKGSYQFENPAYADTHKGSKKLLKP